MFQHVNIFWIYAKTRLVGNIIKKCTTCSFSGGASKYFLPCVFWLYLHICAVFVFVWTDRGWADVHLNPPPALHASAHMQSLLCSQQSWPLLVQLVQLVQRVLLVQLVHFVKNNYAIYLQIYSE